jgi:arginyl-tRNA synthetase
VHLFLTPQEAESNPAIHDDARQYFKSLENGDPDLVSRIYTRSLTIQEALWNRFRDLSLAEYKQLYERLGVGFDLYDFESAHAKGGKGIIASLRQRGNMACGPSHLQRPHI